VPDHHVADCDGRTEIADELTEELLQLVIVDGRNEPAVPWVR